MVIFDANQAVIAATAKASKDFGAEVTESDVRHYFLRLVVECMKRFSAEYGKEIVLAFDSLKGYWRKDEFPYYKFKRKDAKANMPFDMDFAKECANHFYEEMSEGTHFRCVRVDGAEGDDVIAALVMAYGHEKDEIVDATSMVKFMIVSSDEDFIQLQKYQGVDQWSSIRGVHVRDDNPKKHLFEKIVRGDTGDSVPSCLSEDDIFVTKAHRQTPITAKKVDAWYDEFLSSGMPPNDLTTYWFRNKMLVDLSQIPASIQGNIVEAYKASKKGSKTDFLTYMTSKRVKGFENDLQFF